MSSALVIGGDQIGSIRQVLQQQGIQQVHHWTGRKVGDAKRVIPHDTALVVMVTDWLSHNFMHKIKQDVSKRKLRVVYTRNGSARLRTQLKASGAAAMEVACRCLIRMRSIFASI